MSASETKKLDEVIARMRKEKGKTCISIIIPLHHLSFDQKTDKLHCKKAIMAAEETLLLNFAPEALALINALHALYNTVEMNTIQRAIGLYVSENIQFYTSLPFAATEKVLIGRQFDLRDLLLKKQYAQPYYLLLLEENKIQLYAGLLGQLEAVTNTLFPLEYEEDYEYMPAAQSTSYAGYAHVKSFEKDKQAARKKRFRELAQQADALLNEFLVDDAVLVVAGEKRHTATFINATQHAKKVIGVMHGNTKPANENNLRVQTWQSMEAYLSEKMLDALSELQEKTGEARTVRGFYHVWQAIEEGRAETLLIEKDYEMSAAEKQKLNEVSNNITTTDEAVNLLIEKLLQTKAKIFFVTNGLLKDYKRIALITRY